MPERPDIDETAEYSSSESSGSSMSGSSKVGYAVTQPVQELNNLLSGTQRSKKVRRKSIRKLRRHTVEPRSSHASEDLGLNFGQLADMGAR